MQKKNQRRKSCMRENKDLAFEDYYLNKVSVLIWKKLLRDDLKIEI